MNYDSDLCYINLKHYYLTAGRDLFGAEPFGQNEFQPVNPARDPFGMGAFKPGSQDLDTQIQIMDAELMDLQVNRSSKQDSIITISDSCFVVSIKTQ